MWKHFHSLAWSLCSKKILLRRITNCFYFYPCCISYSLFFRFADDLIYCIYHRRIPQGYVPERHKPEVSRLQFADGRGSLTGRSSLYSNNCITGRWRQATCLRDAAAIRGRYSPFCSFSHNDTKAESNWVAIIKNEKKEVYRFHQARSSGLDLVLFRS